MTSPMNTNQRHFRLAARRSRVQRAHASTYGSRIGLAVGRASRPNVAVRAGLAPLELVLSLFFLLVMMALIINFGTIASWRVRGNTAARYAGWRKLGLRMGGNGDPNPSNWQSPATMGLAGAMPLNPQTVGQLWNQQDLSQPALRGPAIVDPASGNQIQMGPQQYLEMVNQVVIGSANLTKKMPLLPNLRKSYIKPLHPVLNQLWRYEDMIFPRSNFVSGHSNIDWGMYPRWTMRNNDDWRLYQWYLFEASNVVSDAYMQYQMADRILQQNSRIPALRLLDREGYALVALHGQLVDNRFPIYDAYPRPAGCDISPQDVQINLLPGLINQIQGPLGGGRGGVPERLARLFRDTIKAEIDFAQQQQPPNQQLISQLQPLVDQLTQFIATLF